jgi:hypothetical protein
VILLGVQPKCRSHASGAGLSCSQIIAKTDIWGNMTLQIIFCDAAAYDGIPERIGSQWLQDR